MSENWSTDLRTKVVLIVVRAIVCLTFALYVVLGVLLLTHQTGPNALWLAAGNASGALFALLVNSKGTPEVPVDAPGPRSVTKRVPPPS